MLTVEQARERILAAIAPLGSGNVRLEEASGRVLAAPLHSLANLPAQDNSAMDGYALRADDVMQATSAHPVTLRLIGRAAAGEVFSGTLQTGECIRVFTGSPLPDGADAVVMQEDVTVDPQASDRIRISEKLTPFENVRLRAEDVREGEELIAAGVKLNPQRLGLAAACGITSVSVHHRPVIGLLATGNELVQPGAPLQPGQVYESNRLMLAAALERLGFATRIFPVVADTPEDTRQGIIEALSECDALITTGGASVGEADYVKTALREAGGEIDFWRVAMRPGKPFIFGHIDGKPVFGLPGNPVSAFVTFHVLVRGALLKMQGLRRTELPGSLGVLGEALVNRGDRPHFFRVRRNASGDIVSAGQQGSHRLRSLADAEGLVEIPPNCTLAEGTPVEILLLD